MLDHREQILSLLKEKIVSEKTARLEKRHVLTFKVRSSATKEQVREAITLFFSLNVVSVNILNQNGKSKRMKGRMIKRSSWKKAYVSFVPDAAMEQKLQEHTTAPIKDEAVLNQSVINEKV